MGCVRIFFVSSRRRHTICALVTGVQTCALPIWSLIHARPVGGRGVSGPLGQRPDVAHQMKKQFAGLLEVHHVSRMFEPAEALDRKSVVEGKSESVRVDLGGRRTIKKKRALISMISAYI